VQPLPLRSSCDDILCVILRILRLYLTTTDKKEAPQQGRAASNPKVTHSSTLNGHRSRSSPGLSLPEKESWTPGIVGGDRRSLCTVAGKKANTSPNSHPQSISKTSRNHCTIRTKSFTLERHLHHRTRASPPICYLIDLAVDLVAAVPSVVKQRRFLSGAASTVALPLPHAHNHLPNDWNPSRINILSLLHRASISPS